MTLWNQTRRKFVLASAAVGVAGALAWPLTARFLSRTIRSWCRLKFRSRDYPKPGMESQSRSSVLFTMTTASWGCRGAQLSENRNCSQARFGLRSRAHYGSFYRPRIFASWSIFALAFRVLLRLLGLLNAQQ